MHNCAKCDESLCKPFSVHVFNNDGTEELHRNKIPNPVGLAVVVALHDGCTSIGRVGRPRGSVAPPPRASMTEPKIFCDGKVYTMRHVRIKTDGARILMVLPRA